MSAPVAPRTPVIVGVGVVQQREPDPARALEATALMTEAAQRAAANARVADVATLLARTQLVSVPKGMWGYTDPGRIIADAIGAAGARSALFEIGVLQPSLFRHACAAIDAGDLDVAIVVGGEAKYRALQAAIAGVAAPESPQEGTGPDEHVLPSADILHPIEIQRGLTVPARQYAIIDAALRHAQGQSVADHRRTLAELWSSFSAVAVDNPDAWNREFATVETMMGTATNPLFALPYTKLHCSQWNVDQASAFIVCAHATAIELGCDPSRFVFPHAIVESNFMAPLVERAEMHRSPAIAEVGRVLAPAIGRPLDHAEHLDLYSCFPAAVRLQIEEFGITPSAHDAFTVTGGMTFGGGPLNNYTFQALARLCVRLRDEPSTVAIATAVSGMLTKFGAWAWSTTAPNDAPVYADVSVAAGAATALLPVDPDYRGSAVVAGYTVAYEKGQPFQAIAIVDTPSGARSIATSHEPTLMRAFADDEWIGRAVEVDGAALTISG